MINKNKVQQVREGKPVFFDKNNPKHTVEDLNEVLPMCLPVPAEVWGNAKYYFIVKDKWMVDMTNPTGLTPIPLDDFFKGEEERINASATCKNCGVEIGSLDFTHCDTCKGVEDYIKDISPNTPPLQSSLPSGVQTWERPKDEVIIDEIAGIMYKRSDTGDDDMWLTSDNFHLVASEILIHLKSINNGK